MAKLTLTQNQHDLILEALDGPMDDSFGEGVQVAPTTAYLDAMFGYLTRLKQKDRKGTKDTFKQVLATFVKAMNWDKPGLGTPAAPVTVTLAKLTGGGSNGSLTIIGGLITAKTDPT